MNADGGRSPGLEGIHQPNHKGRTVCAGANLNLVKMAQTPYDKDVFIMDKNATLCTINDVIEQQEIYFYPNPVSDKLFVDTKGRKNIVMQIVTIDGVLLKEINLGTQSEVDLQDIGSGIYMVQFSNGTNSLLHIISD